MDTPVQATDDQEPSSSGRPCSPFWFETFCSRHPWIKRTCTIVATTAVLLGTGAYILHRRRKRRNKHKNRSVQGLDQQSDDDDTIRIPLQEVVRFKERQWFVEELEASRNGDANAMMRLAKMYLHGQGCVQNIAMAQEWLRKARMGGIYATLDELWAGTPQELEALRRTSAASRAALARRQAAMVEGRAASAS